MKKRVWLLPLVLGLFLLATPLATAQSTLTVDSLEQNIDSTFREQITAELSAEADVEITNVEFFYKVIGQTATSRNVANFDPGTSVDARYSINQIEHYMPPGTELEYWWRLTDADGNTFNTEKEQYLYLDTRHDFKTLVNERITLYWYRGGRSFGEALFEQANKGLNQLEEGVGVSLEQPVKIFIYGDSRDLRNAISAGAQEWTGGQAFTDQGIVVIGIEPSSLDWGLLAMTHELTHLVIHQATDNPYSDLPRWLDEGIAVYNENPEALDRHYLEQFQKAHASNSLHTLQSLTSTFPADPEAAGLAYGQSGAMVKFIIDTYGPDKMAQLLDIFSEGALADSALMEALGEDTWSLDNTFRESVGLPLHDLGLETPAEEEPAEVEQAVEEEAETEDQAAEVEEETEPVEEVAETQTESDDVGLDDAASNTEEEVAVESTESDSNRGFGLNCFGSILPLAALGLFMGHGYSRFRRKRQF